MIDKDLTAGDLEELAAGRLVTGRYKTWRPGDGVAVRTTVGYPRFWRHGPLVFVRELAPYGVFGQGLDPDEGRRRYRERLDANAPAIVTNLAEIARQHPGEPLCLLCFEDVEAGEACHRRWFAEWAKERYGIVVPEMGG